MQIIPSYIAITDCHIQFNCTHFCVHMIFLLMLKICMDKNFLDFSLIFLFSKRSLISLTFPDPLPNSLTFPDFSDRVKTLSLLQQIPKVKSQDPRKFHDFFMNTRKSHFSFDWWPLEFPHVLSLISLTCLIFFWIVHSPSHLEQVTSPKLCSSRK